MTVYNKDIARELESAVPLCLQEGYDNCGWQVGDPDAPCTGVMICVDPVPDRITERSLQGAICLSATIVAVPRTQTDYRRHSRAAGSDGCHR